MTGPELRQQRQRLHLTQKEMAELFPVHPMTLYKWERGERKIPRMAEKILQKILQEKAAKHKA